MLFSYEHIVSMHFCITLCKHDKMMSVNALQSVVIQPKMNPDALHANVMTSNCMRIIFPSHLSTSLCRIIISMYAYQAMNQVCNMYQAPSSFLSPIHQLKECIPVCDAS